MKVRCIAILEGGSVEFSPWLTLGKTYRVLSVERGSNGRTWFRILTNESNGGLEFLGLHAAENFEVTSLYRPSSWSDRNVGGLIETSPAAWQIDGFWDALYDGETDAAMTFERERRLMIEEEP